MSESMSENCDLAHLRAGTMSIREPRLAEIRPIRPPSSWQFPSNHLRTLLESPWYRLLHQINSTIHQSTRSFFEGLGYQHLHVPVTTTSISSPMGLGSDSKPVCATIDGKRLYLADSLQFLLELGIRIAERPVYYISSSFRGEEIDQTHLSEFSHSEVELIGSLDDVIDLAGRYVSHLAGELVRQNTREILSATGSVAHLTEVASLNGKFKRLRFDEVQREYGNSPDLFKQILPDVFALTRSGERLLMETYGTPLWVTHMPKLACPFYQRPENGTTACLSADLLLGPGEVLGSGARCVDARMTSDSLRDHGVNALDYKWYVDMKRIAPLETGGFGLGIERYLMWVLNVPDIRDCTLWLRKCGEVIDP